AAFSTGQIVSALAGIPLGHVLDRHGPRLVMTGASVLGTGALVAIAYAPTLPLYFAAWAVAGVAMAGLFYGPAFAALTRWFGEDRVPALTALTLVAGLSSTIFAPLTGVLAGHIGWRGSYLVLAGILAVITIPLHALALRPQWTEL